MSFIAFREGRLHYSALYGCSSCQAEVDRCWARGTHHLQGFFFIMHTKVGGQGGTGWRLTHMSLFVSILRVGLRLDSP